MATQHDLTESAVRRHRDSHLRKAMTRALEKIDHEEVTADKLIQWTHQLHAKTLMILERAEVNDDLANARGLIKEARENLVLLGRLAGVLEGPVVHVDARKQLAIVSKLSESELRALASGDVIDADAGEVLELVEAAS